MKNKKVTVDLNNRNILVTGAAGFIGSNLLLRLLSDLKGSHIIGIDNLNNYYDPKLKLYRLEQIQDVAHRSDSFFNFIERDIADRNIVSQVFEKYIPTIVVNLAAQAGVRYSITNPDSYVSSNLIGFYNILEACRGLGEKQEHLVYASSSSVYGGNTKIPFSETDSVDHPGSLYAATKKSNELLAHSY